MKKKLSLAVGTIMLASLIAGCNNSEAAAEATEMPAEEASQEVVASTVEAWGSVDAETIKEYLGDNFGVTKLPTITLNAEQKQMKSFAGSKAVGVNPTCKNMEQAVALAAYLGGEESQKLHFEVRGYTPTWKSVTEMPEVKADPVAAAQTLEINEASVTQPLVKNMNNFWTPMEALGKSITQGDVTKESAADATKQMGESINK